MRLLPLLAASVLAIALGCAMQSSVPSDWVRVIDGDYRYAWDPVWGTMPEGMALGNTHGGLATDALGRVFVNTDSPNAIVIFNPDGSLGGQWGNSLAGGLHGCALVEQDGGEYLYMVHTAQHRIVMYSLTGDELWSIGWPQESGKYTDGNRFNPTGIAVAPDGRFWVADGYGRGWVHAYDADGNWLSCFGGPGEEPGKFRTPHGISYDGRAETPRLMVADRENHRVQVFDLDGNYLSMIEGFRRPCGVAIGPEWIAVPDLAGRVTLVDDADRVVAHLGDQPNKELRAKNGVPRDRWQVGLFLAPHGATWDQDGALYVQDWNASGRVTRLVPVR